MIFYLLLNSPKDTLLELGVAKYGGLHLKGEDSTVKSMLVGRTIKQLPQTWNSN